MEPQTRSSDASSETDEKQETAPDDIPVGVPLGHESREAIMLLHGSHEGSYD